MHIVFAPLEPSVQVCPLRQHHPLPQSNGLVPHIAKIPRTVPAGLPTGVPEAHTMSGRRKASKKRILTTD
jgi:hypothetical protein